MSYIYMQNTTVFLEKQLHLLEPISMYSMYNAQAYQLDAVSECIFMCDQVGWGVKTHALLWRKYVEHWEWNVV